MIKSPLCPENRVRYTHDLQHANSTLRLLKRLLPIFASCGIIPHRDGSWHEMESYVRTHSEARFTRSLCRQRAEEPGFDSSQ